jgi:hypothetical protein
MFPFHFFHTISPSNVYLDLGGALSAFGLIFAVRQLLKPSSNVVLSLKNKFCRHSVWWFGAVGLLLVLLRVTLPEDFYWFLPIIFNSQLKLEVIAYLCFILSPSSLLFFSRMSKGIFKPEKAKNFYITIINWIASSKEENIDAIIDVIYLNLDNILKFVKNIDSNNENQNYTRALLDVIFSDDVVLKKVVTKRLDLLIHLLDLIKKYHLSRDQIGLSVTKIMSELFSNKNSFLYRHYVEEGLALPLNIYREIFESPLILENFNLYKEFRVMEENLSSTPNISQVFSKALSYSVETYCKNPDIPPLHINQGIRALSQMLEATFGKIASEESRGVDTKHVLKKEWDLLHTITFFFDHQYRYIPHDNTIDSLVLQRERNPIKARINSTQSLNENIAACIYKMLEAFSGADKKVGYEFFSNKLIGSLDERGSERNNYSIIFTNILWKKIYENVKFGFYPAVLRVYLEYFGHYLAQEDTDGIGFVPTQTKRLRKLLYNDLKVLLDGGKKMANDKEMKDMLLPKNIKYEDGKYILLYEFPRGSQKEISPPVSDSSSAFTNAEIEDGGFASVDLT